MKKLPFILAIIGWCHFTTSAQVARDDARLSTNWSFEVQMNPQNDVAWLNLFEEERNQLERLHDKELSILEFNKLSTTQENISHAVPNSGADLYAQFILSKFSNSAAIEQAVEIYPNNLLVREQMVNNCIVKQSAELEKHLKKEYDLAAFSESELSYARNLLMSVEQHGLLILNAEEDAHPLWYLQYVMKERPDVQTVLLDLLQNESYAKEVASNNGISANELLDKTRSKQLETLLKKSTTPSHLALTTSKTSIQLLAKNLYVVGLCFRYTEEKSFQNMALLDSRFSTFSLSHMNSGEALNKNYLFPMITLRNHYKSVGKPYAEMEAKILTLAAQFGLTNLVKSNFD
ncbi:MAG: hypothetical protein P8N19_02650 [Flavobacteriales bacterium]|nr:hypothetical protein [Flavobacteriales bacterium]